MNNWLWSPNYAKSPIFQNLVYIVEKFRDVWKDFFPKDGFDRFWHLTISVRLGTVYLAETENFLMKIL